MLAIGNSLRILRQQQLLCQLACIRYVLSLNQPTTTPAPACFLPAPSDLLAAQVKGGTLVTLTLQDNNFQVSSTPLGAADGTGAFPTQLTAVIANGTVLSESLIATETLDLSGDNATNASAITVSVQVGEGVTVGGRRPATEAQR